MKTTHLLLASAALASSFSANALVQGTLGGGAGTFAVLSSPTLGVPGSGGTLSGTTSATITGGAVFAADMSFADDVMPGENFLAAGPTPGGFGVLNTATLMFTTPVSYISFLWGSPDTYNTLTVISTGGGSQTFTATGVGFGAAFPVTNGDQSFMQSVQFQGLSGSLITSLVFTSTGDSFEVGHFTVQAPVREPETYALMFGGLGALGFLAVRRKRA